MRKSTLVRRGLTHYWRTNLAVVLGVATAVSVLTGALLVGDSVRGSLRDLVLQRLGRIDLVVFGQSFIREDLAADLQSNDRFKAHFEAASPLIALEGLVIHQQSSRRASDVQIYGVDDRFWSFHGLEMRMEARDAFLSPSLAGELALNPDDSILVTVEKPTAIPVESLHGRKEDLGRSIRLTVRRVLEPHELGEFSIRPHQAAVRAVFVPLDRIQKDLEQPGRVNAILVSKLDSAGSDTQAELEQTLRESYSLKDLGIKLRPLTTRNSISLESDSALVSDALEDVARDAATRLALRTSSILTYLANTIRSGEREIPYSLVTALDEETFQNVRGGSITNPGAVFDAPGPPPIVLNDWAARELEARPGDKVSLEYYLWEDEGRLTTKTAEFQVADIVSIEGPAADPDVAPEYPGITESDRLADWDPPFPMDLSRIRPIDEDYWDRYRTAPKGFILLSDGQKLWSSRYGKLTSLRILPKPDEQLQPTLDAFERALESLIDPTQMGIVVQAAREEGLNASRGATDFGEYFLYFSFFLVASALLLTGLFFKLGVEQRSREVGVLRAAGFPPSAIRALFLREGLALAVAGSMAGLLGAIGYGELLILGLRTWWADAVGTMALGFHLASTSLLVGGAAGIVTALICVGLTLKSMSLVWPRALLTGGWSRVGVTEAGTASPSRMRGRFASSGAILFGIVGLMMLLGAGLNLIGQVSGFFGAGTLLLASLIFLVSTVLRRRKLTLLKGSGWWAVSRLGFRNTGYRPGRSVLCVALIAAATFIIVAVDAFRRGDHNSADPKSGTGGYRLLAESLLPLVYDPNSPEGRETLNLGSDQAVMEEVRFARFRVRPGDDASCLNLYEPTNPRILAATSEFIHSERFGFSESRAGTKEEAANPWLLLDRKLEDDVVPVITDANSMTYVLHRKLGDEIAINSDSGHPLRLRLVAALRDSIFQSELVMSEENFTRLFPEHEGYRFFLVEASEAAAASVTTQLEERLLDFGFDVVPTSERLAEFHRVENTYLSTFQALGGLGLLLGTLGLATVLWRNVLERRRELALLRAVGYNSSHFTLMVVAENTWLLIVGLAVGTACALLAILPAMVSQGGRPSVLSTGLLLLAVLATGLLASVLAGRAAQRSPLLAALRSE